MRALNLSRGAYPISAEIDLASARPVAIESLRVDESGWPSRGIRDLCHVTLGHPDLDRGAQQFRSTPKQQSADCADGPAD